MEHMCDQNDVFDMSDESVACDWCGEDCQAWLMVGNEDADVCPSCIKAAEDRAQAETEAEESHFGEMQGQIQAAFERGVTIKVNRGKITLDGIPAEELGIDSSVVIGMVENILDQMGD